MTETYAIKETVTATRYHDISAGHRVCGHESKCAMLHGHNYRIHFTLQGQQDKLGRVLDFSVIKDRLCQWLEENWDHKFLMWEDDPWYTVLHTEICSSLSNQVACGDAAIVESFVAVPFNPTAENMAKYLIEEIGPYQLSGTGVDLVAVRIEETAKCSAEVTAEKIYHL